MPESIAKHDVGAIGRQFAISGTFLSAAPYGSGHINDTYAAWYVEDGRRTRYIHQRINHAIFKDPVSLMENVQRVTGHVRAKLLATQAPDAERRCLTLVPSREGRSYHRDEQGNTWRTYVFIENARTYDTAASPEQARQAARAFGRFQRLLSDLPAPRLRETIPGFHDTRHRFRQFQDALAADACGRAASARAEIDFALRHEPMVDRLLDRQRAGDLPERITHNDTKLNNVMIDDATGEGICVIDLDTVMPGLALHDFGDMVRTAGCPGPEDTTDLAAVDVSIPFFEALVHGYLETAGEVLVPAERELLVFAGRLITLEIGLRFLADHLAGDTYFKIHREGHNLDRCRVQFRRVESQERHEDEMEAIVRRAGVRILGSAR